MSIEVTEANAREAAAAAQRLLNDTWLKETLDELVAMATERAIFADDKRLRDEARHEVMAIARLRATLMDVANTWRTAAEQRLRAAAHE